MAQDAAIAYPHFQPNQVLSSDSLNSLAGYLEQQGRLTREKLIGIGVVCGLETGFSAVGQHATVKITRGVAVTSRGYAICLDDREYTHSLPYESTRYAPFQDDGNPLPLRELVRPEDVDGRPGQARLTRQAVNGKVVMLLIDKDQRLTDRCLDDNCDQKERVHEFTVRPLLMDASVADEIIDKLPALPPHTRLTTFQDVESVPLARFAKKGAGVRPDLVPLFDAFVLEHQAAIVQGGGRLKTRLDKLHGLFPELFELQLQTGANPFTDFDPATAFQQAQQGNVPVQYVHDWIRDLNDAYDELVRALFRFRGQCAPDPEAFPCHVMLGRLAQRTPGRYDPLDYDPAEEYRHRFVPAPIHDHPAQLRLNVQQLVQRLVLLIDRFKLDGGLGQAEVRITPTRPCSEPLGRRAIPFYYDAAGGSPALFRHWDFETGLRGLSESHLGYEVQSWSDLPHALKPLQYEICSYPDLRIEGHVGLTVNEATTQLRRLRRNLNLDFDIVALKLGRGTRQVFLPEDSWIYDLQATYLVQRNDFVCCAKELLELVRSLLRAGADLDKLAGDIPSAANPTNARTVRGLLSGEQFLRYIRLFRDAMARLIALLPADLKDFEPQEAYPVLDAVHELTKVLAVYIGCFLVGLAGRLQIAGGIQEALVTARAVIADGGVEKEALLKFRPPAKAGHDLGPTTSAVATAFDVVLCTYRELLRLMTKTFAGCLRSRLETIQRLFEQRVETLTIFSAFARRYPGMEHIAGTRRGGTFILVYKETQQDQIVSVKVKDTAGRLLRDDVVEVDVEGESRVLATNAAGMVEVTVPANARHITVFRGVGNRARVSLASAAPTAALARTSAAMMRAIAADGTQPVRAFAASTTLAGNQLKAELKRFALPQAEKAALEDLLVASIDRAENIPAPAAGPKSKFAARDDFEVVGDFYLPCKCLKSDGAVQAAGNVCDRPAVGAPGDIGGLFGKLSVAMLDDIAILEKLKP